MLVKFQIHVKSYILRMTPVASGSGVLIVDFEHISPFVLVYLLDSIVDFEHVIACWVEKYLRPCQTCMIEYHTGTHVLDCVNFGRLNSKKEKKD